MNCVSTPPCRMKSSNSRPTSLSAKAVHTAVRKPKQRRSPRATLYSPPPSQALNSRAVRTRPSPGSRRSMISPRARRSYLQAEAGFKLSVAIGPLEFLHYPRRTGRAAISFSRNEHRVLNKMQSDRPLEISISRVESANYQIPNHRHQVLQGLGLRCHLGVVACCDQPTAVFL